MYQGGIKKLKPNIFKEEENFEYVQASHIRSQIKKRDKEVPFKEKTNELASISSREKPKKINLEFAQKQKENSKRSKLKNSKEFLPSERDYASKIITGNMIEQTEKEKKESQFDIVKSDSPRELSDTENDNESRVCLERKNNQNVLNLQFSDSDSNDNNSAQNSEKGINDHENSKDLEDQIIKENFVPFKPSKCTNIDLSDSSEEQNRKQQQQESCKAKEGKKKFVFHELDLDSEDSQENKTIKNEELSEEADECFTLLRKINILKLRQVNEANESSLICKIPIPQNSKISLVIKRDSDKSEYAVFDSETVSEVLRVEKKIGGNYRFVLPKIKGQKEVVVAKMKVNFLGTDFDLYLSEKFGEMKVKKKCLSIKYEMNILGLNGPRKISIISPDPNWPVVTETPLVELFEKAKIKQDSGLKRYESKEPKWVSELNVYVLNMRGTAVESSIKNCVIVDSSSPSKQFIIFGKKSKDVFNLDIKHPFTILQGVAFAVSSFEKKLGCE